MRYYFYSAILIIIAVVLAAALPFAFNFTDNFITSLQVPQNNAQVAGIQKYNIPPISNNLSIPQFSARSVLIKDLTTGTILYQKDADLSVSVASTTKIMTALVASEYYKQNDVLVVGSSADVSGSKVGLIRGENLSFRSLLYGMLLSSGNDAAFTLAENYAGGLSGFISSMNNKALQLNLKSTRFDNPAGFDSPNHFSSASDLAIITEEALKNSTLARIFATKETNIVSLNKKYTHKVFNLNKLLSNVTGVLGVKTGTTQGAKESLVTLVERDNHRVLIVVLGSNDRFSETTKLIDWVYSNFVWRGV